ncbi:hypothetical protein ACFX2I_011810 [Malus domestica]
MSTRISASTQYVLDGTASSSSTSDDDDDGTGRKRSKIAAASPTGSEIHLLSILSHLSSLLSHLSSNPFNGLLRPLVLKNPNTRHWNQAVMHNCHQALLVKENS